MRRLIVLAVLACAGCADQHALPETHASDPTWQLNKGRWELGVNGLTVPPDAAAPAAPSAEQTTPLLPRSAVQ